MTTIENPVATAEWDLFDVECTAVSDAMNRLGAARGLPPMLWVIEEDGTLRGIARGTDTFDDASRWAKSFDLSDHEARPHTYVNLGPGTRHVWGGTVPGSGRRVRISGRVIDQQISD